MRMIELFIKSQISYPRMDEDDLDLKMKIKEFLSKDAQFRNPSFDPAPYLIEVLKEKSANHEALIDKQNQLIGLENEAQEIIDDVCGQHFEDFIKLLDLPSFYAENLEKLKSNISVVKKKVKQTKALLLNTQKDLQQIHYNCMYNKIIYKKMKEVEMRLYQYQAAFLALKNNQFLLCSLNLPHIEGHSILESTLASRSETLRLRMLSKALDLINLFLFFSPKIVLHSSNALIERISYGKEEELIANWHEHEAFYHRYKLFKRAEYHSYLSTILNPNELDRKESKINLMNDIVKGVINIGRITEITSSIEINGPKQISNVFLLLKCFYVKDGVEENKNAKWFLDRCTNNVSGKSFISAVMCIAGVIFRKCLIIRKICSDYGVEQFQLTSSNIYSIVLEELEKMIKLMYFPSKQSEDGIIEDSSESQLNEKISSKVSRPENYINYGFAGMIIKDGLRIIDRETEEIEKIHFTSAKKEKNVKDKYLRKIVAYDERFYELFHKDFIKTVEEIFGREGRSFIVESYESIMGTKSFSEDEEKFVRNFKSADRKAIKEFIYSLSFIKTLEEYFKNNRLEETILHKYVLFFILVFYLKINSHMENSLITISQLMVIEEQRKTDKKLKKKEEDGKRVFDRILPDREIKEQKKIGEGRKTRIVENSLQTVDKLKIFQIQNKMFFSFCYQFFVYIEQAKNSERVNEYVDLISKLQPANYEENLGPKLVRIWDTLPKDGKDLHEYTAAVLHKIFSFSCIINTKLYRQTGNY